MKFVLSIVLGGALSLVAAFGATSPQNDAAAKKTTSELPFRPYQKRPDATAKSSRAVPHRVATPALPFRPYQKRPTGSASKPETAEASR
jgi:hypothetical protein